jgi:hypothetical protein
VQETVSGTLLPQPLKAQEPMGKKSSGHVTKFKLIL